MPKPHTYASRRARGLALVKVWIPVEALAELDAAAAEAGIGRAELIRTILGVPAWCGYAKPEEDGP